MAAKLLCILGPGVLWTCWSLLWLWLSGELGVSDKVQGRVYWAVWAAVCVTLCVPLVLP